MARTSRKGFLPGRGPGNDRRFGNGAPTNEGGWIWLTRDMLESAAWQAMPYNTLKVVFRIAIEQMSHAGTRNGALVVTFDDFADYGIRRSSIREAVDIAVALGWIDVTVKGGRSYGGAKRPSQYAVTWLPLRNGSPKTNRWRNIDPVAAAHLVAAIRAEAGEAKRRFPLPHSSRNIDRSPTSATRGKARLSAISSDRPSTRSVTGAVAEVLPAAVPEVLPGK